jgi:hypothetical protein
MLHGILHMADGIRSTEQRRIRNSRYGNIMSMRNCLMFSCTGNYRAPCRMPYSETPPSDSKSLDRAGAGELRWSLGSGYHSRSRDAGA